jgi:hypothetical protein
LLKYSWPFTVYSLVNALLAVWYDYSAPLDGPMRGEAQSVLRRIVEFLRIMGWTWWAAAAKHKLSEALLHIGQKLHSRKRPPAETTQGAPSVALPRTTQASTPPSPEQLEKSVDEPEIMEVNPMLKMGDDQSVWDADPEWWPSLGVDLESELADGIFSISSVISGQQVTASTSGHPR